jgi:hypothetical protein
MIFKYYNVGQSITDNGLEKLVVVATYMKSPQGNVFHRNKRPSTGLWHDMTATKKENGEIVLQSKTSSALLVPSKSEGSTYRYYNNADKAKANTMLLLVTASEEHDFYYFNPILRTEKENGVVTVYNDSIINLKPWQEAKDNRDIQGLGCMWYVTNTIDKNYLNNDMIIGAGNTFDFNRGSGRLSYVTLSKSSLVPVDYVYKQQDIDDANVEQLQFKLYHGVKATQPAISVPLKDIFA